MKNASKKFLKRIGCFMVGGVILLGSLYGVTALVKHNTVEAEASKDALMSFASLRDQVMAGDTYTVLEIVPEAGAGRLGYYIPGQEPFAALADGQGGYRNWTDVLLQTPDETDRFTLMNGLVEEAQNVLNTYFASAPSGITPFTVEPYMEFDTEGEGRYPLNFETSVRRGYFTFTSHEDHTGDWNVVFAIQKDRNLTLSEINSGVENVYYIELVNDRQSLTNAQVLNFYDSVYAEDTILYSLGTNNELVFAGNADQVGDVVSEKFDYDETANVYVQQQTVSGNDENQEILYGPALTDPSGYYLASFAATNVNTGDEVYATVGDFIYVVDTANTYELEGEGEYSFVETSEGVAGDIFTESANTVYYSGGIISNDLFRKNVVLTEEKDSEFGMRVLTLTPTQVTQRIQNNTLSLSDIDMISISNQTVSGAYGFSSANDLTLDSAKAIASEIYKSKKPVLVDLNGIVANVNGTYLDYDTNTSVYLKKLVAFLLSTSQSNYIKADGTFESSFDELTITQAATQIGALDADHDLAFLNKSVWFYNGAVKTADRASHHLFVNSNFTSYAYNGNEVGGGFSEVYDEILLENQYRAADTSFSGQSLDTTINDAAVFRHIMGYAHARTVTVKTKLTVLDIEPFMNTASITAGQVRNWVGLQASAPVQIDCMQMNAFIGKIDDLNEKYDLIYIGGNTAGKNTNNGQTVYNDSGMNGLLYSHIGDLYNINRDVAGMMEGDFHDNPDDGWNQPDNLIEASNVRVSGNDLTLEKYNALLEYLNGSYPIVIGSALLNSDGSINPDRVDNSSYLYEFLTTYLGHSCVVRETALTNNSSDNGNFVFYVNRPKLWLEANSAYPNIITAGSNYNDNVTKINPDATGKFYLQYRFTIRNAGEVNFDEKYTCKLYLDANADGKFSEKSEEMSQISITADGRSVSPTDLRSNVEYTVTKQIPDDFFGCITWNLEVSQTANKYVRTEHQGYTKLETGGSATKIKILQIYMTTRNGTVPGTNINLETQIGGLNEAGTGYASANSDTTFGRVARQVSSDYLLDITAIKQSTFNSNYASYDIDTYDMLILGFSDAVRSNSDFSEGAIKWIQEFIENGKSVLMAHDLTSFINLSDDDLNTTQGVTANTYVWGYQMNRKIRSLVGMDTYGISEGNLKTGGPYYPLRYRQGYSRENLSQPLSMTYNGTTYTLPEPTKDTLGFYQYGTYDVAYNYKSGRISTAAETHGFNFYNVLNRLQTGATYNYRYDQSISGNTITTKVANVNDGQICNFPFVIPTNSEFSIGDTHAQYYSLDFNADSDNDGQTDIVVWFNLSNNKFDKDPGDVKNNYYIYSRGNVTYTGMGHIGWVTEMEAKLFINTMIASYNSGRRAPEIITSNDSGTETDLFYNYFDSVLGASGEKLNDSSVTVSIMVNDINMTAGDKSVTLKLFSEDKSGAGTQISVLNHATGTNLTDTTVVNANGDPINVLDRTSDSAIKVYYYDNDAKKEGMHAVSQRAGYVAGDGTSDGAAYVLDVGKRYYIDIPVSYFTDSGYHTRFLIAGYTQFDREVASAVQLGETTHVYYYTPWNFQTINYVTVDLFDLD